MISKYLRLIGLVLVALIFTSCASVPPIAPVNDPVEHPLTEPDQNQTRKFEKIEFSVFFNNIKKDPNMLDCSSVHPVLREFNRDLNYEEVIRALMQGPSEEEKAEGYISNFPESAELNYVIVSGRAAKIDFKSLTISGSCATQAARAQITETLQQFPWVDEVIITVKMQIEGVLEP